MFWINKEVDILKTAQVMISCMYQDLDIIQRSNLTHDVLVINQCDVKDEVIKHYPNNIIWVDTPTRGLSCSRNLALEKAEGEVCLIADDDEFFEPNIQEKVFEIFVRHQEIDVLVLQGKNYGYKTSKGFHKMNYIELFHINSISIAVRRNSIIDKNILFDVNIGSGTGNGAGEEFKFVLDCKRKGLQIYYYPLIKSSVNLKSESQWFKGFNKKYFYNKGATNRYILGFLLAVLYALYWTITHRDLYQKYVSIYDALKENLRGVVNNPIGK